ncbi:hypothetical protein BGZ63DRAFT_456341 [Mariannaea sp. PMI_226]|nr:hypothetical protein BGZ63DRAFT_456341 [Mariannaea sp. PMI_226]
MQPSQQSSSFEHEVSTLTNVIIFVRVAGTTLPPVDVEYVSTTWLVIVTDLVVTRMDVTGTEVHQVSKTVLVIVRSDKQGADLDDTTELSPIWSVEGENGTNADEAGDSTDDAAIEISDGINDDPRDKSKDDISVATEIQVEGGTKPHEVVWSGLPLVVPCSIVTQDTVAAGVWSVEWPGTQLFVSGGLLLNEFESNQKC